MRFLEVGESLLSPRNEHHFLGSMFSAIGNAFSTADTNDANATQAQLNRSFQRQEAKKTRDWQEKMWNKQNEYNSPEAMISRGLNPFVQGASGTGASVPTGAQAGSVSTPSMQAPHFDFSSVDQALASFAQAKKALSEANQIDTLTPYMVDKILGDTNYRNIGVGRSGYWNKETGRISAELDQSMERQQLENAITAGKLSAAQTTQIYLQADSQAILNKYMDAQQQADLFTKAQYLYNLVQQGALTEKQVQTELQRAIQIAAQTQGQNISNKIAAGTADALMSATNMAYYTQYYDSLWDYKNVNNRKSMQYSKDKALRDYYKWSAGNSKKDFESYGIRNAIDYGTKMFQSMPRSKVLFRGNPFAANGIGY
jgi:hypothetical protein